jgi:hypothetical protein
MADLTSRTAVTVATPHEIGQSIGMDKPSRTVPFITRRLMTSDTHRLSLVRVDGVYPSHRLQK